VMVGEIGKQTVAIICKLVSDLITKVYV